MRTFLQIIVGLGLLGLAMSHWLGALVAVLIIVTIVWSRSLS